MRRSIPHPRSGLLCLLAATAGAVPLRPAVAQERLPEATRDRRPALAHERPPDGVQDRRPERTSSIRDSEWHAWGSRLFLLVGLGFADPIARDGVRDLEGGFADGLADAGRWLGSWKSSGPFLLGGTLLLAIGSDGGAGLRRAGAVVFGVFAGSMANEALNVAVGRSRPVEEAGLWQLEPFDGHASFPSGHAAYMFAFAAAADEATEGWVVPVLVYSAATLTGLSRIYHDRHWLTDVAAGAMMGGLTARFATKKALRLLNVRTTPDHRSVDSADGASTRPSLLDHLHPIATLTFVGLQITF